MICVVCFIMIDLRFALGLVYSGNLLVDFVVCI